MKLYLDLGNSRTKWCLDNGESSHHGACSNGDWFSLKVDIDSHASGSFVDVVAASVAGAEMETRLNRWIEDNLNISPVFAQVERHLAGVTACYENLSRLGVDRWLSMLAAYNECKTACIAISAGTALTIDYISSEGHHLGGVIAPGLEMMRKALFSGTSNIKLESLTLPQTWLPGCDTVPCVQAGIAGAIEGLLAKALSYVPGDRDSPRGNSAFGHSRRVLVTGGDRSVIAQWCGGQAEVREFMVLQGLKLWDETH